MDILDSVVAAPIPGSLGMSPAMSAASADLAERWQQAWPAALAAWSRYTRLQAPQLCGTTAEALREGLSGSFAMIRLVDQRVVIDLQQVAALGLSDHAIEVLAHEIGHHVYAPASVTDQLRLLARIRRALPTLEEHAPLVANLYTDLHINDRLQRQAELRMDAVFRQLNRANERSADALWRLYLRIDERLWKLDAGSLCGESDTLDPERKERLENDAWLGARLVRLYANDWLDGAGRFAALLLPYLIDRAEPHPALAQWQDTRSAAQGADPSGMLIAEAGEVDGAIHPSEDPRIAGFDNEHEDDVPAEADTRTERSAVQTREPFELGELLKAAGVTLSDHELAVRYYRERALPHRVPFPKRPAPRAQEPELAGLDPWEIGNAIDQIDWLASLASSPMLVPGVTTFQRQYEQHTGEMPANAPCDLDVYIDSSGSMPNPQHNTSWLTLAGTVIALSALRAGARVQATLWSGKGQIKQTAGFVRDETAILRVMTDFYGGATAFPVHALRDTYARRKPSGRAVHILMISDEGIDTMFDDDERGESGWAIAARALATARGGGTMALNLPSGLLAPGRDELPKRFYAKPRAALERAQREQGWVIESVSEWQQLLGFARRFAQRHYSAGKTR